MYRAKHLAQAFEVGLGQAVVARRPAGRAEGVAQIGDRVAPDGKGQLGSFPPLLLGDAEHDRAGVQHCGQRCQPALVDVLGAEVAE